MLTLCVFTYEASGLISNTRKKKKTNKTSLLGAVTLRVIILLVTMTMTPASLFTLK